MTKLNSDPTDAVENQRRMATFIGLSAVVMWSLLGLLTALSGQVPPFLLNAMCFGISGIGALIFVISRGRWNRVVPKSLPAFLLGVAGLFGYHFLYFTALRNAPAVEANLLNYLWPLLIVLFSGLLPGEHLQRHHVLGAAFGFAGAALLIGGNGFAGLTLTNLTGYIAAIGAALVWSSYSVLSRRFANVATESVAIACLATSVLSLICHFAFEPTILPAHPSEWVAVLALGALPVGAAFFVWDIGMKRGRIQILGAAAYAAPVLSTLLLIAVGIGHASPLVMLACILVTAGAVLASKDVIFKSRTK